MLSAFLCTRFLLLLVQVGSLAPQLVASIAPLAFSSLLLWLSLVPPAFVRMLSFSLAGLASARPVLQVRVQVVGRNRIRIRQRSSFSVFRVYRAVQCCVQSSTDFISEMLSTERSPDYLCQLGDAFLYFLVVLG